MIDFDEACTQADCDAETQIHLPQGFRPKTRDKCVIKLLKNLHGLRQGGCNFYERLKTELTSTKRGFIQSESDPCDFHRKGIIVLCYAYDCLTFAHDQKLIDKLIMHLKGFLLCTDEGEADRNFGVEIKSKDGVMTSE